MAKAKLLEKIKTDLKASLTKVNKKTIEKKSQKISKSKALKKDTEKFDSSDDETLVTTVAANQNIQIVPIDNDGFLGESEDSGPDFITNEDVQTTSTINNAGLLSVDDNGDICVIGETDYSVEDIITHSFQQTSIS